MKVKVCGMRDGANIDAVAQLGVDYLGLIFYPRSSRFVTQIPVHAGIIPDRPLEGISKPERTYKLVGVFVNEMPQTIVTRVYNYHLDCIQLHGEESVTMIDNLRATLVPDICKEITIIKALSISCPEDVAKYREYEGHVDMFLFDTKCKGYGGSGKQFDWDVLTQYDGETPFLLSGGIGPDDAERVKAFCHTKCIGIDLNSNFEDAPAMKNVGKLKDFISKIK